MLGAEPRSEKLNEDVNLSKCDTFSAGSDSTAECKRGKSLHPAWMQFFSKLSSLLPKCLTLHRPHTVQLCVPAGSG